MKKKVVVGAALMMMPLVSFAGGYLTNTNQHAAFLRSLSRGAAIDIDGALSNPAGLSFLPTDGFRVGVSIQSAFQTRDIDASFGTYNGFDPVNKVPTVSDVPYKKYYKGKAAAPVIRVPDPCGSDNYFPTCLFLPFYHMHFCRNGFWR
jgi:long-chain fatty acid transport protein